jgi:hypothetical protein
MAKDTPTTPQGNPGHGLDAVTHVDPARLPVDRVIDKPPQGTEFVPPDRSYEVKVARLSKEAERAAEMGARGRVEKAAVNLNNVINPPKPQAAIAAPTAEELDAIRARISPAAKNGDTPVEPELLSAVRMILNKFRSLSADWGNKIDVMKSERRMRDDQVVLALMAYTLDAGQHMNIPLDHPYFMDNYKSAGSNFECLMCGTVQSRKYPGQPPLCAPPWEDGIVKQCAPRFRALTQTEQAELLSIAG